MFSRRLVAKIIDALIYIIIGGSLVISIGIAVDTALALGIVDSLLAMQESLVAAGTDAEKVNQILNDNALLTYGTILYSSIFGLIIAMLYFGIAGKLLKGSIGKKIMGITINTTNDSIFTYIKREPLIHVSIFSLVILIISYFIPTIILFDIFSFIYLILFAFGKDYWNNFANSSVSIKNK